MKQLEYQLSQWALSATRVAVTPEISSKLGAFADEARQMEQKVDAFVFSYEVHELKVSGFIVAPKGVHTPLPAIMYNRGGTADFGLITHGALLTRLARLAQWGYVVVGSQYPGNRTSEGHDERGGESDVESVLSLKNLLDHLDIVDEKRIGMYGVSRGGMMTYLCLSRVDWIRAALTVGGLANLDRTLEHRPDMAELYERHFTNTKQQRARRSAVKWADQLHKTTPLFLLHGGDDDRVNPMDTLELAMELQKVNHPYALRIFEHGDHALRNIADERDRLVRSWFDKYLRSCRDRARIRCCRSSGRRFAGKRLVPQK